MGARKYDLTLPADHGPAHRAGSSLVDVAAVAIGWPRPHFFVRA